MTRPSDNPQSMAPTFDDPTEGTWVRDLVHYPSPMTAFGASLYLPRLEQAVSQVAGEFGLMFEGLQQYWRSGDIYGRVVPVGGKEGTPPPWWVLALLSRVLPPMRKRMQTAAGVLQSDRLDQLVRHWNNGGRRELEAEIRRLAARDLDELDDDGLLDHRLAKELLDWDDDRALALLAGCSQASSAPGRELAAIAEQIRGVEGARDALADNDDPVAALRPLDSALADELDDWLRRWGLRASAYDPGSPTLAEQPGLLHGLVRDAVQQKMDDNTPDVATPLTEVHRQLASRPEERARFEAAFEEAKRVFPLREDNVLYTDNLICGLSRLAALAIGRRLVQRGALEHAEDAVDLKHDELCAALRGEQPDVATLATRRRGERQWVEAHPGPDLLRGEATPPPDLRGLPAAGRTINQAFMWAMGLEYPELSQEAQLDDSSGAAGDTLSGIGAWPGAHTGTVRLVRDEGDLAKVRPGDVMVARITVPAWSVVFPRIGALVTDRGGVLSHAAIVAREHAIPTVLATGDATSRLRDGQRVVVDGTRGTVTPA
jgi:pyruvate,water dikinase